MAFARTVVENHSVATTIDQASQANPRFRDLFDGLIWRIAREPEAGYLVPDTDPPRYVIRSDELPGFPSVLILAYIFTDHKAEVIGARIVSKEELVSSLKLA